MLFDQIYEGVILMLKRWLIGHYVLNVDRQMLAIVLIWRVGKIHEIKMTPLFCVSLQNIRFTNNIFAK
jgi:hypothetical protein